MNGNGITACANCGALLNGTYRIVAYDRPRVNIPTCGGRCQTEVEGWSLARVNLYIAGQAVRGQIHAANHH